MTNPTNKPFRDTAVRILAKLARGLLALTVAIAAVIVVTVTPAFIADHLDSLATWHAILLILFGAWTAVALHELGHALAARYNGFRVMQFAALPLVVSFHPHRTDMQFSFNPGFLGGHIRALPPLDGKRLQERYARIVIAGPIASALVASTYLFSGNLEIAPVAEAFLVGVWSYSLVVFLLTVTPHQFGGSPSDGKQWLTHFLKRRESETHLAMLILMSQFHATFDAKALDDALIRRLVDDPQQAPAAMGRYFALLKAMAQKDTVSAKAHAQQIEEFLSAQNIQKEPGFAWALAVYFARLGDSEKATRYSAMTQAGAVEPCGRHYFSALLSKAAGDHAKARDEMSEAHRLLQSPRYTDEWKAAVAKDFDNLRQDIEMNLAETAEMG